MILCWHLLTFKYLNQDMNECKMEKFQNLNVFKINMKIINKE